MSQRHVMSPDHASLVTAAKSGDGEAFNELVRITIGDTYALAFRLCGNKDDANDVVQEAYLRAYKAIRKFRGDAAFQTWMYRITSNTAITMLRNRNRHAHDDLPEVIQEQSPELDPVWVSDAQDTRRQLHDALLGLSPALRSVVVLRDVYDMAHEEVASQLGISRTAAKVRLHRARQQLKERMYYAHNQGFVDEEVRDAS